MIMNIILALERNVYSVIAKIVLSIVEMTLLFKCAVYFCVCFMKRGLLSVPLDSTQSLREIYLQNVEKCPACFKEVENDDKWIKGSNRAHMPNTPDLSRVVFTSRRIESDCDRNRKWAQGA